VLEVVLSLSKGWLTWTVKAGMSLGKLVMVNSCQKAS
jgi:hypothetical protein